jgi:thiamine-monophosphate kinase
MRVSDLGEFGLIGRIAGLLPSPPPDVVVGIGDDVAVLRTSGPDYLLATCDSQVENVHFVRESITAFQLGRRVVAINVSDIAAMGGTPTWALVSLALPSDLRVGFVDELYLGMREQILEAGAAVVGGNISKIQGNMVIDVFLLGRVPADKFVLRSGAREGDMIMVTNTLGDSRAGLELLRHPALKVSKSSRDHVETKHLTPQPRLLEGRILAGSGHVHAMADISDGLVSDLRHICRASHAGAEIWVDRLPIGPESREVAYAAGLDALHWAMGGGEDYELLFTVAPAFAANVQRAIENETGTKVHVVGQIVDELQGIQLSLSNGERIPCPPGPLGWDHFAVS